MSCGRVCTRVCVDVHVCVYVRVCTSVRTFLLLLSSEYDLGAALTWGSPRLYTPRLYTPRLYC